MSRLLFSHPFPYIFPYYCKRESFFVEYGENIPFFEKNIFRSEVDMKFAESSLFVVKLNLTGCKDFIDTRVIEVTETYVSIEENHIPRKKREIKVADYK